MPEAAPLVVRLGREIAFPVEEVWACLVGNDHIRRWWYEDVELEPVVGGRFREPYRTRDGARKVTSGRVLEVEAPNLIRLSWADEDWPVDTEVCVRLRATPGGTRLELEHRDWQKFPSDRATLLCDAHAAGWDYHLDNFRAYVEARLAGHRP